MSNLTDEQRHSLLLLKQPFAITEIEFLPMSTWTDKATNKQKAAVAPYVDARAVQDRLDEIIGADDWDFDWDVASSKPECVTSAKGKLTIYGITKCDVGAGEKTETTKASVSDSLKRAGVMWGIGRYLYRLGRMYCELEKRGENWVIPDNERARLRREVAIATARLFPKTTKTEVA